MTSAKREGQAEEILGQMRRVFAKTLFDVGNAKSGAPLPMLQHFAFHGTLQDGGTTQRELAEFLGVSTGYVTGLVDRLERDGLAVRRRDSVDRRVIHVSATPQGRRVHARLHAGLSARFSNAFDGWSDADIQTFQGFLARLAIRSRELHEQHRRSPGGRRRTE
ncbi:MAG: MarR family transcriptional regulator [Thermoplasmata archaeon]|nr:MarR family transcriptional regulator [Thermoplasmata archaeon]